VSETPDATKGGGTTYDDLPLLALERQFNEAILAALYPIELAIMQTRAQTITGLAVKARHAAYVMSQYWEAPLDQIDWDARTVRLLIEAVCETAGASPIFRGAVDADR
jgi:hypothetical protein